MRVEEFDVEKQWWGGKSRKGREETEQAWRVDVNDIIANNYNLDIKNPTPSTQATAIRMNCCKNTKIY